jgi:hypothetical protein
MSEAAPGPVPSFGALEAQLEAAIARDTAAVDRYLRAAPPAWRSAPLSMLTDRRVFVELYAADTQTSAWQQFTRQLGGHAACSQVGALCRRWAGMGVGRAPAALGGGGAGRPCIKIVPPAAPRAGTHKPLYRPSPLPTGC